MGKKKFQINVAICDARNVTEETLKTYESVNINAALIVVSKESNDLMSRYDVNMNAATIEEAPANVEILIQNGKYEITDSTRLSKPVALVVNGKLEIETDSPEVLEMFHTIIVNGKVSYPSNLENKLPRISVNGKIETYPADAIRLNSSFTMDRTFILRAENAKYFASNKVIIADRDLDIDKLVEKGVTFITKKAIIAEELLEESLFMFDPEVEIEVIPTGYNYVKSQVLSDVLINKHGDSLYVDGDLTVTLEGEEALNKLNSIMVLGTVYINNRLKEIFNKIDSQYNDMKTIKGHILGDKASLSVDSRLISKYGEGVTIQDCGTVNIKDHVSPEEIEEKLQFIDCGYIACSEEQKGAVESVSENVGFIDDSGKSKLSALKGLLDKSGILDKDTKSINAISYTM